MVRKLHQALQSRAISAEAKMERRNQILGAAEQLVKHAGHSLISVAEVARQAGIAKGTVYLYFKTKEDIYLGLHELWITRNLDALTALITDQSRSINGQVIGSAMADMMLAEPHALMTASTCRSLVETQLELDTAIDFKLNLAKRLGDIGELIEQRFKGLPKHSGVRILVRSHAMTIGLWQLMDTSSRLRKIEQASGLEAFNGDFATELRAALIALWRGALQEDSNDEQQ